MMHVNSEKNNRSPRIKSLSVFKKLEFYCVLYIALWAVSPIFSTGIIYRILAIISTGIYLTSFYLVRRKPFYLDTIIAFLFILITAIINYLTEGSAGVLRNFQLYIFIFFYIIYKNDRIEIKNPLNSIIIPILLLFFYSNIITLHEYKSISNISRMMTKNFDGIEYYAQKGVGGFGLVYSQILLIPMIIHIILKKIYRNIGINLFFIIYIFSALALIFKAGFTIAVIITLVIILMYFILKDRKIANVISLIFFVLFIFLIGYIFNNYIFNFLLELTQGTSYHLKVMDIYNSVKFHEITGTLGFRLERYTRSLIYFLKSPLLGQIWYGKLGKHSPILDIFAQYGVIIGILFLKITLGTQLKMIRYSNGKLSSLTLAIFIGSLMLLLTNNIPSSLGVCLFIIYPVIYNICKKGDLE